MEDVVSYPIERPSIGEKRLMMELTESVEYAELIPSEKRSNVFSNGGNPNQPPIKSGLERGEKRSATEALANQTSTFIIYLCILYLTIMH